ncbi:peptidase inhibitor family I36 protein [Sphaerisporangium corydalis]|uniref:Peptidase inhibitor family I36 protein n=1 Tax=Sphaerisporangium corydalis TaxID=1441875 RepID=A0ABV9ER50_9ACTN|nr:peptidase inhibitor family I36 protein [Sphaerisporangium corydalis]
MSQRTQVDFASRLPRQRRIFVRAAKLRFLGALAAAAVLVPALATGSAQASSAGTARQAAAVRGVHVFAETGFSGPNTWLDGNVGQCYYVGSGWNDTINSARTESSRLVELWDNSNCTGGAIVVDRTGYSSIGDWVSGYRIR